MKMEMKDVCDEGEVKVRDEDDRLCKRSHNILEMAEFVEKRIVACVIFEYIMEEGSGEGSSQDVEEP